MKLTKQENLAIKHFHQALEEELGDNFRNMYLFGSKARGDAAEDSDIDLLVICVGEDWRIADRVYSIATDILLETGISLSPKVISHNVYEQMREQSMPFYENISREGVAV